MAGNNGSIDEMTGQEPAAGDDYMAPSIGFEESEQGQESGPEEMGYEAEDSVGIESMDPLAFEAANNQRLKESQQSIEELRKQKESLKQRANSAENKQKKANLDEIFNQTEMSTYAGVQKALSGEVENRIKSEQQRMIEKQRKEIEGEGLRKLFMAALYKSKILTKPEINKNPKVDNFAIVNGVLQDFVEKGKEHVGKLNTSVDACTNKYEQLDEKCDNYEDVIIDHIVFYENLEEQRKNGASKIQDLESAKRGLQKKKGQNPLDAEVKQALNHCIKDYKSEKRQEKQLYKLKRETQRDMRKLKDNYSVAKNNKEIYEGLMNLGQDKLSSAEIHLNRVIQIQKNQKENETIGTLLADITEVATLEKTMAEAYGPFFKHLDKLFEHINEVGKEFEKGKNLIDIPAIKKYNKQEGINDDTAYKDLKAMVDF